MIEPVAATRFLDLSDGRIAYDDTGGEAPFVLCIPGMGDLRSQFRVLRRQLVEAQWRVVTMDLRGTGESSVAWPSYTPSDVADDAAALLRAKTRGRPAIVVGNSVAAASAIKMAATSAELVRALVLLGPVARDQSLPELQALAFSAVVAVGFAGPWGPAAWVAYYRRLYPTFARAGQPADLGEHLVALKRDLAERGRMAALRGFIRASKAESAALAGQVRARVFAVMGSADPDVVDPAAELDRLAHAVGAKTLLLDGIGHYPHLEKPAITGPAVVEFLSTV